MSQFEETRGIAQDAPTSSPSPRRRDIQGLRAIAVLVVIAFHANLPVPGGFVGVDVFFVISGFVITAMLLREKQATGSIRLTTFFARRFRRLAPALAVMVAITVIVSAFLMSPLGSQQLVTSTAIGSMLMFANFAIAQFSGGYFGVVAETNPLLHTWSLSVEEQFYLAFPILLILSWWIGARFGRPRPVVAIAIASIALISLAIALASSAGFSVPLVPQILLGFYSPVGRVWEFAAGALLALASTRMRFPVRQVSLVLGLFGSALLVWSVLALDESTPNPGVATLLPVAATVLILLAGFVPGNPFSRVLACRPLVALGNISYSLYLWHWPLIVFASLIWADLWWAPLAAAGFSIIPAILSYRFIEQPLRQQNRVRTARRGRRWLAGLVALTTLVPIGFATTLDVAIKNDYWSSSMTLMRDTQQFHAGLPAGCIAFDPITSQTQDQCTWNKDASGVPIYLIGDSIVEQYSEALIGASLELDRPLVVATAPGCPPYRIIVAVSESSNPIDATEEAGCAPYIDGTLEWLKQQPAGLVIMGANDVSWWSPSDVVDSIAMTGDRGNAAALAKVSAAAHSEKKRALVAAMQSTADSVIEAGHKVVIAKAPPSYRFPLPSWKPGNCSVAVVMSGACHTSATVLEMDEVQGSTREAVDQAALLSGSAVLDLRDYFCPDDVCTTRHGDLGLYRDDIHISVPASEDLAPWFANYLHALG